MTKYAGLLLFIFTGCSTLQLSTSIPEEELKENQYSLYDPDSNIQYQVSNDQENLHIKFKTSDWSSIMKIINQGSKIYFDIKGKQKKDVFVEYPMTGQKGMNTRPDMKQVPGQASTPELSNMLEVVPKEAVFTSHKESEIIQFSLVETDIKPSITVTGKSEITYDLIIPFHRLSENGLASITTLSIGIVTESMNMQSMDGVRADRMGGAGGRSGGGKGGSGGGRSGGGMSGAGGDRSGGRMGQGEMPTPINIWFLVDLYRE